jgi:hypothetical protein
MVDSYLFDCCPGTLRRHIHYPAGEVLAIITFLHAGKKVNYCMKKAIIPLPTTLFIERK